jgi:hypothetical protein
MLWVLGCFGIVGWWVKGLGAWKEGVRYGCVDMGSMEEDEDGEEVVGWYYGY